MNIEIKNRYTHEIMFNETVDDTDPYPWRTVLERLVTQGANLRQAYLQHAELQDAALQGADLSGADLRGANLHGVHLKSAWLQWASLRDCNLQNADLQDTILQYAGFRNADLRGANLQNASVRGADFQGACLQGIDLHSAALQGDDLSNIHNTMNETQETICQWASATLGTPTSNLSIAERAQKEMRELLVALDKDDKTPEAPVEAADVFIVLMRLFQAYGTTWQEEVNKKMIINRARKWVRDGNGHGNHVKTLGDGNV